MDLFLFLCFEKKLLKLFAYLLLTAFHCLYLTRSNESNIDNSFRIIIVKIIIIKVKLYSIKTHIFTKNVTLTESSVTRTI